MITNIITMKKDNLLNSRKCCPACLSEQAELLLEEPYDSPLMERYFAEHYEGRALIAPLAGHAYQLLLCRNCGLAYQRSVPGEWLLGEIYDKWIPQLEREKLRQSYTLEKYRYWAEQIEFIIQHLQKPPYTVRVLDFGLGWAEWARMAQAYGCEVMGTELSNERIDNAKRFGIHVIEYEEIPEHCFDYINTEQVFEHLINPREVLHKLAGSLSENGVIKLSVPDGRKVLRRLYKGVPLSSFTTSDLMPIAPLEHINVYTNESLVRFAAQFGLKVMTPNFLRLWNSASGWFIPRSATKLLLRPIYRHVWPKSTFCYFTKQ